MSESTPGSTGPEQPVAAETEQATEAAPPVAPAGTEASTQEAPQPAPEEPPTTGVPEPATTEPEPAAPTEPDAAAPAEPAPTEPEPAAAAPAEPTSAEPDAAPAEPGATAPEAAAEPTTPETTETDAPQAGSQKPAAPKPGAPKPSALAGAPKPSAIRRPAAAGAPSGSVPATPGAPATPVMPVAPAAVDAAEAAAAEGFGRVDDDGTVFVREAAGEREVGQFPGVPASEAMSLYVRRYLDLSAKVALFETRLSSADLSVREIDQTLTKLTEETTEPAAVGDLDGLRARVESLRSAAAERRAALEQERAAAKAAAVEARTAIVDTAEKIAATDPAKMQWRPAGEELRTLLDQWKEAQRSGPRIDRPTEEALWKRFSHARTAFDRERRHFFADLEQRNAAAKTTKEKLVVEAEALQHSTDWGATAAAYRDLMARWKAAGRANRKDDDALWARFRGAQDTFFAARDSENAAIDAEYAQNLEVKEALLVEAEALLPVTDLQRAKNALRDIQERWEEAGKVPRGDLQRVEGRLRAVESAVRDADQARWDRTNPETRARAEGAAAQLESAIESLEADLAKARAAGDSRRVTELESDIAARRSWLEQVVRAAQESRG
ncbi:DUF349 domain-containing protein [Isoptericola sp. NEAU-Y5]|uniref:DUF349 domain-containing protein n=1 Tax=Isoptericola luteus TaxID=2879484 RepID=A0ABS7ZG99_9MICO|nr:DUF349 domain-containing protein [Isoptericola sp. NEAU-Y5]MCA5894047.1 DUF349 domain-containing protein [Isoptericola sp. NEAU-Y5]